MALLGKPTPPCPPPPSPNVEKMVGLPAKETELTEEKAESDADLLQTAGYILKNDVLKYPNAKAKSNDYNRRGNRNH